MHATNGNIIDAGDVLIIGAGLAGLFTALKLGARPVTVMAAGKRTKGAASKWAQGGIAAALGPCRPVDDKLVLASPLGRRRVPREQLGG